MKIILSNINKNTSEALRQAFKNEANVEVLDGDILQHEATCIVSPANSFGFMDGGIDLAYSEHFGWDVQQRLQEKIKALPGRELLVGQALLVETGDTRIPWMISAPTMRVPMKLQGTVNVYLAFRASLQLALSEGFESLLSPGMGTGVGELPPDVAAGQMKAAYMEVFGKLDAESPDILAAYRSHHLIVRGTPFLGV